MNTFLNELKLKIIKSIYNDYGLENYDTLRFGEYIAPSKVTLNVKLKRIVKWIIGYNTSNIAENYIQQLEYKNELSFLWSNLNEKGRSVLVELIAYRLLGYNKVKLSRNNKEFRKAINMANKLANPNDYLDYKYMHFVLYKMHLTLIGKDIQFYFIPLGVAIDFIIEQYAYKNNGQNIIEAKPGDIVLDIGGCWGDTALYFADKVGENGKVYSFEFIPNNISIFTKNISLNPHLKSQIILIEQPVTNKSDDIIYYLDKGPGSWIKTEPFEGQTGQTSTISIDDFVEKHNITKVDFIKMDIEGAEPIALQGALNTIIKFRPKLAIAIYHSMSDFVNIPKWILDLNLDYELNLAHYTIHAEETIIFAQPRK